MKRRSFLTMLGLAPVAATLPAVAAKASSPAPLDSVYICGQSNFIIEAQTEGVTRIILRADRLDIFE